MTGQDMNWETLEKYLAKPKSKKEIENFQPSWLRNAERQAKKLWENRTEVEVTLSFELRDLKQSWKEQVVLGSAEQYYIVDFWFPKQRIAVEVDGKGHFEGSQVSYDSERDNFLVRKKRAIVLRFSNEQVLASPKSIKEAILNCIRESKKLHQMRQKESNILSKRDRERPS